MFKNCLDTELIYEGFHYVYNLLFVHTIKGDLCFSIQVILFSKAVVLIVLGRTWYLYQVG